MTSSDRRWLSFHVASSSPFEPFLVSELLPLVATLRRERRIKRFFFIRYGEGEPHLRIRFMPTGQEHVPMITRTLSAAAERWDVCSAAAPSRLAVAPYDRTEHYFGETLHSVYAELLNEQTSDIALRLLRIFPSRPHRLVMVGAIAARVIDASSYDECDSRHALFAWREFAMSASLKFGMASDIDERTHAALVRVLANATPRVGSRLQQDENVAQFGRLLRRVRPLGDRGRFVAVHALHLLCNKVGFTLSDEVALAGSLHSMMRECPV